MTHMRRLGEILAAAAVVAALCYVSSATAMRLSSPNYRLDGNSAATFGGRLSSTNYKMTTVGAEAVVGNGASGSYKLGQGYATAGASSLQLSLQPGGLVNYFAFDENTGTVAYDGTANAAQATLSGGASWTTGKINSAVYFDGVNGAATIPYTSMPLTSGHLTVSGWVKVASTNPSAPYQLITDRRIDSSNSGFSISVSKANGSIAASSTFNGVAYTTSTNGYAVTDGQWHYFAYTVDGQYINMYLDGVRRGYTPYSGTLDMPGIDVRVAGTLNGSIDELKYFDRALSAQEVSTAYAAQSGGVTSALNLGSLSGGVSSSANVDAIVQTNVAAYNLAISEDHDMQTAGSSGATPDQTESFETPPAGANLTTSNTSYGYVLMGSGATAVAMNSPTPLRGNFARYTSSSTASYAYGQFNLSSLSAFYSRMYFRLAAYPTGQSLYLMHIRDSGAVESSNVKVSTAGKISLSNLNNAVATTAGALPLNQWIRAEVFWNRAAGTQTLQLYYGANVEGTTPDDTLTGAAGGSSTAVDVGFGAVYAPKTGYHVDIDDTAVSAAGWLGSAVVVPGSTIPAISSTIASPATWNEGLTTGLGFAVVGAPTTDGRWGGGTKYASFPTSATTFYSQRVKTDNLKDVISLNARVSIRGDQAPGAYGNTVTIVGTTLP